MHGWVAEVRYRSSENDIPIVCGHTSLDKALAALERRRIDRSASGGHTILGGQVVDVDGNIVEQWGTQPPPVTDTPLETK